MLLDTSELNFEQSLDAMKQIIAAESRLRRQDGTILYLAPAGMDRVPRRVPCPRRGPGQPEKNSDQGVYSGPNHISAIDPVFVIITRFWGRRMIVFAKKELFEINAFLSWFFRCAGAMCVRGTKEEAAVIDETVARCQTVRACSSSRRAPVRKTERSCSQRAACSSLRQRLLWTWCRCASTTRRRTEK